MENLITLTLFGRSYTIKTELDVDKAKAVADILTKAVERIQESIAGQSPEMEKLNVLMLAALNMASDIYKLEQNQLEFFAKLNERSAHLNQLIDNSLKKTELS
ncbi:MAG: cell division protein ZapA [Proteobacteria bacterium]|nr:cell division protein ZapA [Pseudomonadota bacterium]MBU4053790.1 cell division protein ZapA [Pseudomonadota bacterium]